MSDLEVLRFIAFKMFFAVICGTIIGIERRMHDATAGFKTQILVCVGSMLFTVTPMIGGLQGTPADSTFRVIAQIISGVGFLGAGAILHNGTRHVIGLTTAAWIWFTAAIGIMVGLGHGPVALFTTTSLIFVITVARRIEHHYFSKVDHDKPEVNSIRKAG